LLEIFRRGDNSFILAQQTGNISYDLTDDTFFIALPVFGQPNAAEQTRSNVSLLNMVITRWTIVTNTNTLGDTVTLTMRLDSVDVVPAVVITITAGVDATFTAISNTPVALDAMMSARVDVTDPAEAGGCVTNTTGISGRVT